MKYGYLFILLFCLSNLFGQTSLPFRENGRWGLINPDKKVVLEPKYDFVFNFENNEYAPFLEKGKYGVLDVNGKEVIPAENKHLKILNGSYFAFKKEGGYGLKNPKGEILVPEIFILMKSIGIDLVQAENDTCKLLFNTKNQNEIWVKGKTIYATKEFFILWNKDSCYLYDKDLTPIFGTIYSSFYPEVNGIWFSFESSDLFIPNDFKGQFKDGQSPLYAINSKNNLFVVKEKGSFGVYDPLSNHYQLKPEYEWIEFLNQQYSRVKKGAYIGLIDENGDWLIQPKYADIYNFNNSFLVQNSDYKSGILSLTGNTIIAPKYDWIEDKSTYYLIRDNGKFGLVSKQGVVIESPRYNEIKEVDGSFKCYRGPKYNKKGKIIKYEELVSFSFERNQVAGRMEFKDVGVINIASINRKTRSISEDLNIEVDSIFRWKKVNKTLKIDGLSYTDKFWGFRDSSLSQFIVRPAYTDIEVFEDRNYTFAKKFNSFRSKRLNSPLDDLSYESEYHLIDHSDIRKYPKKKGFLSLSSVYNDNDELEFFKGDRFLFLSMDSLKTWECTFIDKLNSDQTRRVSYTGKYEFCDVKDPLMVSDSRSFISSISTSYNSGVPRGIQNRLMYSGKFKNAPFKIGNGKWTLIDENNERLLPDYYDFIQKPVRQKYLMVENGKWGIMTQDSILVPSQFQQLKRMRNQEDSILISANNHFEEFLIDSMGNKLQLNPEIKIMKAEGSGILFMEKGKYGLYGKDLKVAIDPEFGKLKYLGFGWYRFRKRGKLGLVKSDGAQIPPKFKELLPLSEKYIVFSSKRSKGLLNEIGDTLLQPVYEEIQLIEELVLAKTKKEMHLIQLSNLKMKKIKGTFKGEMGNLLVFSFGEGTIFFKRNGKKVKSFSKSKFVQLNQNKVLLLDGNQINIYNENLVLLGSVSGKIELLGGDFYSELSDKSYQIKKIGSKGIFDEGGILKIHKYGNLFVYKAHGRYQLLNSETGKRFTFPESVAKILSFQNDYFRVYNKDRSQAFYDFEAKNIYNRNFDQCTDFKDGFSIVKEGDETKIYYQDGRLIEGLIYHKIFPIAGGYFKAQILKRYGVVSENKGVLLKAEFDKVLYSKENFVQLIKDGDVFYYDFEKDEMIK